MFAVLQQSCISGRTDPSKKSNEKQNNTDSGFFNCPNVAPFHLRLTQGCYYTLQLLTLLHDSTLDLTQRRFILKQMTRDVMLEG